MNYKPSLQDLLFAKRVFSPDSRINPMSIRWIHERLPFFAKVFTAFKSFDWWKKKYVAPLFYEEARSFLKRYVEGHYIKGEERFLFDLFSFVLDEKDLFLTCMDESEKKEFSESPFSFKKAKEAFEKQYGRQKASFWFDTESLFEYRERLNKARIEIPSEEYPAEVEVPRQPYVVKPLLPKELLDDAQKLSNDLKEAMHEVLQIKRKFDKEYSRAFPLQFEDEVLLRDIFTKKEEAFSLLLKIEESLLHVGECYALQKEIEKSDFQERIHHETMNLIKFKKEIPKKRDEVQVSCDRVRKLENRSRDSLDDIVHRIEKEPLLQPGETFRTTQQKLLKTAKEKCRTFRQSLDRSPGPSSQIDCLRYDVESLLMLSKSFYEEGKKISSMKKELQRCVSEGESYEETRLGKSPKELLECVQKMKRLLENIEIDPFAEEEFLKLSQQFRKTLQ